jgi:hypothetical protein
LLAGELPQAGEGERLQILAPEPIRLLAIGPLLPLEEPGGGIRARRLAKASRNNAFS